MTGFNKNWQQEARNSILSTMEKVQKSKTVTEFVRLNI